MEFAVVVTLSLLAGVIVLLLGTVYEQSRTIARQSAALQQLTTLPANADETLSYYVAAAAERLNELSRLQNREVA